MFLKCSFEDKIAFFGCNCLTNNAMQKSKYAYSLRKFKYEVLLETDPLNKTVKYNREAQ